MRLSSAALSAGFLAFALAGCLAGNEDTEGPGPVSEPPRAGGALTAFDATGSAFSDPAPGLSETELRRHQDGDALFSATFVTSPSPVQPGLGPLFNDVSCTACHVRDGRGRPPEGGEPMLGMLIRVSGPGTDAHGGPAPVAGFGIQIQTRGVAGQAPEATLDIAYRDSSIALGGGGSATLRIPAYALRDPWTPLPATPLLSPRLAPPLLGMGLLEALDEDSLLARADPEDRDGDGISGRPNRVYDPARGGMALGRFGWKANSAGLMQQTAAAFNQDMGVTTPLFPDENCADERPECAGGPAGQGPDLDSAGLAAVAYYLETLAVPARRDWDQPPVARGERLFASAGCAACHIPTQTTGTVPGRPELSGQIIHAYTDLLLHDLGPGLADGRPDFDADGREWRTSPLWGLGLTRLVNGHSCLLHDGRARDPLEAILWHGGEAEKARETVRAMAPADREALLAFLSSL